MLREVLGEGNYKFKSQLIEPQDVFNEASKARNVGWLRLN